MIDNQVIKRDWSYDCTDLKSLKSNISTTNEMENLEADIFDNSRILSDDLTTKPRRASSILSILEKRFSERKKTNTSELVK